MKGGARAAYRRLLREIGAKAGDRTYGGLLPEEHRFPPQAGLIDLYDKRTDIRPDDLHVVDRGTDDDNMTSVLVSHVAAGVSASGRAADAEQAFVAAMQQLRGRLVLIRLERERERAREGAVADADDCGGETSES